MQNRKQRKGSIVKKLEDFVKVDIGSSGPEIEKNRNGTLKPIFVAEKKRKSEQPSVSPWYIKLVNPITNSNDPAVIKHAEEVAKREALMEVVAQELIRLLNGDHAQPKTRLVRNAEAGVWVASKAVQNSQSLERFFRPETENSSPAPQDPAPRIQGIGATIIFALWVQEIDFKSGNLLVKKPDNNIIKIDGGWSFAQYRSMNSVALKTCKFLISANLIDNLPFITTKAVGHKLGPSDDYYAYNWLEQIWNGKVEDNSYLQEFRDNPIFRREIHEAILKIITIPDDVLKIFIDRHFSDAIANDEDQALGTDLKELVLQRKQAFLAAALANSRFKEYAMSELARDDLKRYAIFLSDFKIACKIKLGEELNRSDWEKTLFDGLEKITALIVSQRVETTIEPFCFFSKDVQRIDEKNFQAPLKDLKNSESREDKRRRKG